MLIEKVVPGDFLSKGQRIRVYRKLIDRIHQKDPRLIGLSLLESVAMEMPVINFNGELLPEFLEVSHVVKKYQANIVLMSGGMMNAVGVSILRSFIDSIMQCYDPDFLDVRMFCYSVISEVNLSMLN